MICCLPQSLYRQKNLCAMKRNSTLLIRFKSLFFRSLLLCAVTLSISVIGRAQALQVSLGNYAMCSGGSIQLAPMVSGGTQPYTYIWTPAAGLSCSDCSSPTATPSQTTTYQLRVRDFENVERTAISVVTVVASPSISVAPTSFSVCTGGSVTISSIRQNGTGGCTVQWQSGPSTTGPWTNISDANGNTYSPVTSTPGTTYFRATYTCMGSGCNAATSNVATVRVFAPPAPTLSPASQTICTDGLATITLQPNGGTGPCGVVWQRSLNGTDNWTTINWSNGTTLEVVGDTEGTAYYRALYDCNVSSCGSTISSVAAVTTSGISSTPLSLSPESSSVCAGAFVVLTATPGGGSGTCSYRWQIATSPNGPWLDMSSNWNGPELYPATQGWAIDATHYYRVIYSCTGGSCNTTVSDPVSVSVSAIPAVSISPTTNFVCQNEPLTLQAAVSGGTGGCTMQWMSGPTATGPWTPVPGAVGVTCLPPTDVPGTVYYTASYGCNGTNCGSAIIGQPAKVVTLTQANISVSVNDSVVCVGGLPLLTAQLQNGSPECPLQWQRSDFADGPWINISQATQSTYQVPSGNPDTSFYRVVYACRPDPVATSGITMTIGSASNVAQGQQVCLDVRVHNFSNIVGMQFSMQYNPAMLQFTSVSNFGLPGMTAGGSFGLPLTGGAGMTAPGTITMTWTDPDQGGESLSNNSRLFTLCFSALANTGATSVVFTVTPTTIEVINTALQNVPFNSTPGTVSFGSGGGGTPNPISLIVGGQSNVMSGQQVCLDVTAQNFNSINSFQATVTYNAAMLQNAEVSHFGIAGMSAANFNTTTPGTITVYWFNAAPQTLPQNEVLFRLCFTANTDDGSTQVAVGSIVATNGANQFVQATSVGGNVFFNTQTGLTMTISNASNVVLGQQLCLNVSTEDFTNILGLQFSINYNPALLRLTSVSNFGLPALSASGNFALPIPGGAGITSQGRLTLLWTAPNNTPVSRPNGTIVFTLCFNVLSDAENTQVVFSNSPSVIEVTNGQMQSIPFNGVPGTVFPLENCFNAISNVISITVRPDPAIGLLPAQQTICLNSNTTLTTQLSGGAGDCSFQWFSAPGPNGPWTLIPNAEGDNYQPPTDQLGLTYYQVVRTCTGSGCGQPASNPAAVFVSDDLFGDEIRATPLACNVWRLSPVLPPDYFGPINALWTLPDGSTSTELQIVATQTGVYQLQISIPNSPCASYLARYINAEADECASIAGYVRQDLNENCQPQTVEPGLANWMVRAIGAAGVFHAITNDEGRYQFSLPLGAYEISLLPPSVSWLLCADSYPVILDQSGQTRQLDMPVKYVRPCPELEAQLSTLSLRRCFTSTYVVKICNVGTEIAEAPVATLVLDDFLSYQSAQLTPSSVQGQTITWTLPSLAPGQCRQFEVRVLVSCNATLGQTHCSTLSVVPDSLCIPTSPAWSGANLQVSGECAGNQARFRVRNAGAGDLDDPVPCIVIEDVVMLMHQPNTINQLSIGEEAVFDFPANGSTYFFSVGQAPHHPFGNPVTVALEGCGTNDAGTFSTGFVNQLPLQNATTASHTLCLPNIGAYDPNDKQAIPVGYGPEHFIRAGDPLHYKIRFQNTGTDTAFTIIIRDTLSPWLDMATLRPGPSSHDYKVHIDGERTLVFTFDNILLPDSTTHLDGSQGFVDFFIHTLDSIPLDTRIENSAAIYFDFNEPVITNTVFHTIGTDFIRSATAVFQPDAQSANWKLMPNPAQEEAWLVLEKAEPGLKTVWLYDAFGRQVLRLPFEGERCRLPLAGLTPGWYALQLTDAAGRSLGAGRLVVR
jgi:uncharacterized repeat protein (TIGR01451 family)